MSNPTVLIVDDEPNIITPLEFLMEQRGYNVFVADTGEKGFQLIEEVNPDLVLLDIMLPGIDGFEVCRKIRENPSSAKTKIILITAMSGEADMEKGISMGADAFIIKPFSNAEVVKKVDELLKSDEQK